MNGSKMLEIILKPDLYSPSALRAALNRGYLRIEYLDSHHEAGYLGAEYVEVVSELVGYHHDTLSLPCSGLLHRVAQHPQYYTTDVIVKAHALEAREVRQHLYEPHDVLGARRAKGDLVCLRQAEMRQ